MPITNTSAFQSLKSKNKPSLKPRPILEAIGKAITTSVPSIAVRFHSGDEELDIYPSADDEDDGEKDDVRSTSSATAVTSASTLSNTSTSAQSCDPSPMKDYLKGLGKRSTSVDAGIMDVGSSSGDTWRIFHELKGKITKTVEEKLTEIKSERRSGTPLFSGKSSPRHGRLRAGGGNSQDNSSISDSEDISECSNRDESRASQTSEPAATSAQQRPAQRDRPPATEGEDEEMPSTSVDEAVLDEPVAEKGKKGRRTGLRHRKGTDSVERYALDDDTDDSGSRALLEDDIESGVEVSEETKFAVDTSLYEDIPTVDYRVGSQRSFSPLAPPPPLAKRRSLTRSNLQLSTAGQIVRKVWTCHKVIVFILVAVLLTVVPFPPLLKGFVFGIMISMIYHIIVGMRDWYLPAGDIAEPFTGIPDYTNTPVPEVASKDEVEIITKYGGWMNELSDTYDPNTYHINNTHSVYIRLDGSILRVSHPKAKIPKRALWNERKLKMKFLHQRIYDISDCSIMLLPEGITRKRRWSKKYPICILLKKESKQRQTVFGVPSDPDGSAVPKEMTPGAISLEFLEEEQSSDNLLLNTLLRNEEIELVNTKARKDSLDEPEKSEDIPVQDELSSSMEVAEDEHTGLMFEPVEPSDDDTFCIIDEPLGQETCLYLFSRTDRQKEDWYRKFVEAAKCEHCDEGEKLMKEGVVQQNIVGPQPSTLPPRNTSDASEESVAESNFEFVAPSALHCADMEYINFMKKFDLKGTRDHKAEKMAGSMDVDHDVGCDVMWINSLVGRMLYDVLQNPSWVEKIEAKIQKKLVTIKLPFFVEELLLVGTDLGRDIPMVRWASRPALDAHGLWVDLDVAYDGRALLTLETKINLMRLKKEMGASDAHDEAPPTPPTAQDTQDAASARRTSPDKCKSPIYDSSVEDSAESSPTESDQDRVITSSDDEDFQQSANGKSQSTTPPNEASGLATPPPQASLLGTVGQEKKRASVGSNRGMLKMVNKIVASHFFQTATENKYIKRAMEGVSNTQITLTVEVRTLSGRLAVNIPPPPSDRLWYGFRGKPRLWISVRPKFGHRQVNFTYVTRWLEKKLLEEFQKKFVLPNMDDLVIPPMTTDLPE